jgi:acetyl-CoA/propionyl-CoA carboxylase biotin carboxyl carrier protein
VGVVRQVGPGVYQVDVNGRTETVYVAGPPQDRWVFWNGRVFRGDFRQASAVRVGRDGPSAKHTLTAPMPATVITVHVKPGDAVTKGQVLMLLEAMKMELPIRAPSDGVIAAVYGREGELVPADASLVEFQT